jgi:hypothetical protein
MRRRNGSPARNATGIAALVLLAALAGCAGHYGSARLDTGVGRGFADAEVLPAHRYYTTGSDTSPDAILALRDTAPSRAICGARWR